MKIVTVLLAAALTLSMANVESLAQEPPSQNRAYIVEDNYSSSDAYRIIKSKNAYEKLTIHSREHYKQTVQSTKEILRLPICLEVEKIDGGFLPPSKVKGIVMDIPFNYYSNLESSSKYFQTLLYNGWEIEYYNATSLCIQVGLLKEGVVCRILIYKDYLKVYCKLI